WTRHYQPGVPARIELPTESLVELYERSVAEAGSAVATEFFGRETSYAELGDQIARAAAGLRELGVRAGDRVALVLPNCPQHIVAVYAVLRLGAAVVAHTPLYPARELRHMFEDHGARVVIAWDAAVAKLREQPSDIELDRIVSVNLLTALPRAKQLALRLPVPRLRALRGKLTQPAPGTMAWEELLQSPPIDPAHPRPAPAGHDGRGGAPPVPAARPGPPPPRRRRPRRHPVPLRHHRPPQGRDAHARHPLRQRPPGRGVDARRRGASRGVLRGAADVP